MPTGYNYIVEDYNGSGKDIRIGVTTRTGTLSSGGISTVNTHTMEGFIDEVLQVAYTNVTDQTLTDRFNNVLAALQASINLVEDPAIDSALTELGFEVGDTLDTPTSFTAVQTNPGEVTLSWDFDPDVENYKIMQATQADFSDEVEVFNDVGEEPEIIVGLANDHYYFRINAHITGFNDSAWATADVVVS